MAFRDLCITDKAKSQFNEEFYGWLTGYYKIYTLQLIIAKTGNELFVVCHDKRFSINHDTINKLCSFVADNSIYLLIVLA